MLIFDEPVNGLDTEGIAGTTGPGPSGGPRVLVVTTFDLDEYVYEALRARASGVVLKDTTAQDLVAAEQTVKTHVGRILIKLGLRDRTQAAIHAYETGLVRPGE